MSGTPRKTGIAASAGALPILVSSDQCSHPAASDSKCGARVVVQIGCADRSMPARTEPAFVVAAGLVGWSTRSWVLAGLIVAIAIVSARSAVSDARTRTIPNRLVVRGLAAVAVAVPALVLFDGRSSRDLFVGASVGITLAGAPLLFALWLVRPASVGGGDWKLLTAQSATVGLIGPLAAPLILLWGCIVATAYRIGRPSADEAPLGPGLAVGFLVAVACAVRWPDLFGGPRS